jgi:hypothetical protein
MAVSREKIFEEIWAEPITTVSKRYDVSDSFFVRICKRLNVPRPPMGYWAKLAAGITTPKPLLPDAKPGDDIEWARNGYAQVMPYPPPEALESSTFKRVRSIKNRPSKHKLITDAPEHYKDINETMSGYLKPRKKLLLDLIASKKSVSRGLEIANELFLALEDRGHPVELAAYAQSFHRNTVEVREKPLRTQHYSDVWSPCQPTLLFVGTVAIGLTIFEMSEEIEVRNVNGKYIPVDHLPASKHKYGSYSWTSKQDIPSGRFCLQAYSPYRNTEWQQQWRESKSVNLERLFKTIISTLEQQSSQIVGLVNEEARLVEIQRQKRELEWQKWKIEEAERKRVRDIKESKSDLLAIIEAWAEAKRIESFFEDAESRTSALDHEEYGAIHNRLAEARELLGGIDALERFKSWKTPKER